MRNLVIVLLLVLMAACDKPEAPFVCEGNLIFNENESAGSASSIFSNGVYVLNEGGFTNGNSRIDFYNPASGAVTNGIFELVNGFPLGDVLQSITVENDRVYVVVNNSQKIEVLNAQSFERISTISNFDSPRFLSVVRNDNTAISAPYVMVTDFLANQIKIVNIQNACVIESLDREGWTEQIFSVTDDSFWILERSQTGAANEFARMIQADNELNLLSEVDLPIEPNSITIDDNENIWVLSSGKEADNILPSLLRLNTSSKQIDLLLEFSDWTNIPLNLVVDSDGEQLYFSLGSEIFTMNITDTSLPVSSLFVTAAQNIYALSIPLDDNNIYVSDARDYIQNGSISIYSNQGVFVNEFQSGVIPAKVLPSN